MITRSMIADAIASLGMSEEVRIRNDYSGRGMYGVTCPGITGSFRNCQRVIAQVINQDADDRITAIDGNLRAKMDSSNDFQSIVCSILNFQCDTMGYDSVIYWPQLPPFEPEDELESEED